jgi:hypothetical protein
MQRFQEPSFNLGKYCISPLTLQDQQGGSFEASVSIRSGRGRESHDRVYRFLPRFPSRAAAHRYAAREGVLLAQQACLA